MTITHPVRILLPMIRLPLKQTIYFKGTIIEQHEIVIYITQFTTKHDQFFFDQNEKENIIYGCIANTISKKTKTYGKNFLIIDHLKCLQIKKLILKNTLIDSVDDCIIMLYDYNTIKKSETINGCGEYFSKLQVLICNGCETQSDLFQEHHMKSLYWFSSSMFAQHVLNYINLIIWLKHTIKKDKKVSIKQGNIILSILADIVLGYLILQLVTLDKKELSSMLMGVLEKMVNLLYSLLKWLMGAPAGLKLNNAFNKMLGKYFSYHIQLWWLFLDVSGEKLDIILHIYHYVGYLGFTFQAAMISDMICVATFHSYCIYVYAARLFNIQVSGLIALLRLFVGRKYNPLRGGIDSCEYTNQELFVGTVAFTILLLLLPTTTMYYIVFTLFRLLSLVVQYSLAKIIYIVQTLPLYVATLWLVRSPKVAGNILIETVNDNEGCPLVLKVNLLNKSLGELMNTFRAPVEALKQFEWTNVLSNVFIGKQIN